MKTITYSLASQRCLDEGWTVRPPTPPECEDDIPEVFEPEPILPNAVPASIEVNIPDYKLYKCIICLVDRYYGNFY